jgi:hypothetical protein
MIYLESWCEALIAPKRNWDDFGIDVTSIAGGASYNWKHKIRKIIWRLGEHRITVYFSLVWTFYFRLLFLPRCVDSGGVLSLESATSRLLGYTDIHLT